MSASLVGSEMCIRDRGCPTRGTSRLSGGPQAGRPCTWPWSTHQHGASRPTSCTPGTDAASWPLL
eukprot:9904211-Alexandrium_andersonii.AAC.1